MSTFGADQAKPVVGDDLQFDPAYIFTGPPVYIRKQVSYIGHATTTYSVEQAITIIDYIGEKEESEHCLPFAVRLIENGEMISVAEDNGEFSCGELLTNCLKKIEGFNILVCVTQKVDNCFVTDMLQSQKQRVIKEAATKALDLLYASLTAVDKSAASAEDSFHFDATQIDLTSMETSLPPAVPLPSKTSERSSKIVNSSGRFKGVR